MINYLAIQICFYTADPNYDLLSVNFLGGLVCCHLGINSIGDKITIINGDKNYLNIHLVFHLMKLLRTFSLLFMNKNKIFLLMNS